MYLFRPTYLFISTVIVCFSDVIVTLLWLVDSSCSLSAQMRFLRIPSRFECFSNA